MVLNISTPLTFHSKSFSRVLGKMLRSRNFLCSWWQYKQFWLQILHIIKKNTGSKILHILHLLFYQVFWEQTKHSETSTRTNYASVNGCKNTLAQSWKFIGQPYSWFVCKFKVPLFTLFNFISIIVNKDNCCSKILIC